MQYAPTIFYERKKEGGPQCRSGLDGIITWMLQSVTFFTSFVFNFYITVRLKETISVVVRRLDSKIQSKDLSYIIGFFSSGDD